MANQFNRYQEEMARRGLGSTFQLEGPEGVGAGPAMAGPFGGMSAQEAMAAGASPEALRELGRNRQRGINIDVMPRQVGSGRQGAAGIDTIFSELATQGQRAQGIGSGQSPMESDIFTDETLDFIRSFAPESAPIGNLLEKQKRQADAADVAAKLEARPESMTGLEALEAPMASTLAGGRGTVVEKPGERPLGGRGKMVEAPGERAAALAGDGAEAEPADPVQQGFMAGMQEYLNAARGADGATEPRSLEEYKKEFAEATGIDISGKPDKSQALMAFGLALMQNRAGKGFNVGRILRSVGEAGEAALPALEKAKQEAKANAVAAGKYALEMRSADRAKAEAAKEKAMSRQNYYVVPKGKGVSGFLANMDKGSLEPLNVYELNKLQSNPDFTSKYDIVPGSMWGKVVEEAMKAPEAKELYLTKNPYEIPLFTGVDDDLFKIRVYDPDVNKNPNGRPIMVGDGQEQYEALARMARDNAKAEQTFVDLKILAEGQNIFKFSLDKLNAYAAAFNVKFGKDMTDSQRIKTILNKLQAKNAPEILGEAGKTISDGDRQRVAQIVGELNAGTDPRELTGKIEALFNDIVGGAKADIRQALSTLNRYTGRNIGQAMDQGDLSDEEQAERIAGLKALGVM